MKKICSFALVAAATFSLFAQDGADPAVRAEQKREHNMWPAFFAVCEFPANHDVMGLRLTIPFSTVQENITGIDLGLWGRCLTFEGFQFNVLRNDVKDDMCGFQVGLYNSTGGGQLLGFQAGLWNEAHMMRGLQVGLVNTSGQTEGLQVGLINRAETMHGYQVGLINVIRDAELEFCPVINIGW